MFSAPPDADLRTRSMRTAAFYTWSDIKYIYFEDWSWIKTDITEKNSLMKWKKKLC